MKLWKQKVNIPDVGEVFVEAETKFPWEVKGHIERILKMDHGITKFDMIGTPEEVNQWFTSKQLLYSHRSPCYVTGGLQQDLPKCKRKI